jgi:hypothetical protein
MIQNFAKYTMAGCIEEERGAVLYPVPEFDSAFLIGHRSRTFAHPPCLLSSSVTPDLIIQTQSHQKRKYSDLNYHRTRSPSICLNRARQLANQLGAQTIVVTTYYSFNRTSTAYFYLCVSMDVRAWTRIVDCFPNGCAAHRTLAANNCRSNLGQIAIELLDELRKDLVCMLFNGSWS